MKLIDKKTGRELRIGDKALTSQYGTEVTILGMSKPHKPSSTGRVFLELADGTASEYYPAVINARWIED